MSHSHSHSHDDHDHDHDHSGGSHDHSNDLTPALQSNLYSQIDFDKIVTLNESVSGSGMAVVKKTWEERLEPEPDLVSDVDEQLLMVVP
jgi:RNA polymerase I-specific transcription initiation factor RRN6